MLKLRLLIPLTLLAALASTAFAQSPGQPQGPGRAVAPVQTSSAGSFRATNYEIRASLDAVGQVMNALAKVDFVAGEPGRVVEVELNPSQRVNTVRDGAGKPVTFDRDDNPSSKLHVTLNDSVPAGGKVTLQFDYNGPLSSRIGDPTQTLKLSYIGKEGGYLLLPARWFPLTNFPSNRFTGVFQIEVPGNMVVVGTGVSTGTPASVTPKFTPGPALGNAIGNAIGPSSGRSGIHFDRSSAAVDGERAHAVHVPRG